MTPSSSQPSPEKQYYLFNEANGTFTAHSEKKEVRTWRSWLTWTPVALQEARKIKRYIENHKTDEDKPLVEKAKLLAEVITQKAIAKADQSSNTESKTAIERIRVGILGNPTSSPEDSLIKAQLEVALEKWTDIPEKYKPYILRAPNDNSKILAINEGGIFEELAKSPEDIGTLLNNLREDSSLKSKLGEMTSKAAHRPQKDSSKSAKNDGPALSSILKKSKPPESTEGIKKVKWAPEVQKSPLEDLPAPVDAPLPPTAASIIMGPVITAIPVLPPLDHSIIPSTAERPFIGSSDRIPEGASCFSANGITYQRMGDSNFYDAGISEGTSFKPEKGIYTILISENGLELAIPRKQGDTIEWIVIPKVFFRVLKGEISPDKRLSSERITQLIAQSDELKGYLTGAGYVKGFPGIDWGRALEATEAQEAALEEAALSIDKRGDPIEVNDSSNTIYKFYLTKFAKTREVEGCNILVHESKEFYLITQGEKKIKITANEFLCFMGNYDLIDKLNLAAINKFKGGFDAQLRGLLQNLGYKVPPEIDWEAAAKIKPIKDKKGQDFYPTDDFQRTGTITAGWEDRAIMKRHDGLSYFLWSKMKNNPTDVRSTSGVTQELLRYYLKDESAIDLLSVKEMRKTIDFEKLTDICGSLILAGYDASQPDWDNLIFQATAQRKAIADRYWPDPEKCWKVEAPDVEYVVEDVTKVTNASFSLIPRTGTIASGWEDCPVLQRVNPDSKKKEFCIVTQVEPELTTRVLSEDAFNVLMGGYNFMLARYSPELQTELVDLPQLRLALQNAGYQIGDGVFRAKAWNVSFMSDSIKDDEGNFEHIVLSQMLLLSDGTESFFRSSPPSDLLSLNSIQSDGVISKTRLLSRRAFNILKKYKDLDELPDYLMELGRYQKTEVFRAFATLKEHIKNQRALGRCSFEGFL